MLERSVVGVPIRSTDKLVLGSDEGVKLGSTDCKLLGYALIVDNGIIIDTDERVHLVSYRGSFDVSSKGVLEDSFLGSTLGFIDNFFTWSLWCYL